MFSVEHKGHFKPQFSITCLKAVSMTQILQQGSTTASLKRVWLRGQRKWSGAVASACSRLVNPTDSLHTRRSQQSNEQHEH